MTSNRSSLAFVARTIVRSARMLDRVDSGLTLPQYRLLTLLDAGDERSTALAQRLAVSKPAISTAVEILSGLGHIRRRAVDGDKRASWLQITDSGVAALRHADDAYAERLTSVVDRLDDPQAFIEMIAGFADALDADIAERRRPRDSDPPASVLPAGISTTTSTKEAASE